jgi:mannose-6-phosphate isomerase-like protein (cupin superfamily)
MTALIRATDAEVLPYSGVTLFADVPDTAGALTSHRSAFTRGKPGAPAHTHRNASELFYLLDGTLDVLTGEEIVTLHRGDLLVVPPGVPHAFAAPADSDAEVLFVLTGAVPRFDYYRLLEQVYRGEADPAVLAETQDRFDNHYVDSPVWTAHTAS